MWRHCVHRLTTRSSLWATADMTGIICTRFSTFKTKSSSTTNTAPILGTLLLLTMLSDPFISVLESNQQDFNTSYWKMHNKDQDREVKHSISGCCRLRNSDTDQKEDSLNSPPDYSRIVIVGGGMAGLHTALCLAERMENPNSQEVHPPENKSRRKWFGRRTVQNDSNSNKSHIIVLEAEEIGNGASGRAKGLVVPGFQVPIENLEMNAHDYETLDSTASRSAPSILRSVQTTLGIADSTPRYSKAIVQELYNATYLALDRLRDIVKKYEINCDWVESGAVEASIHDKIGEDEGDLVAEEDDGCCMLTSRQVGQIIGRNVDDASDANCLYKWGEYDPSCAGLNPLALTFGLADAVERWGVKIYENAKVAKLEKLHISHEQSQFKHGKYILTTKDGHTIQCDHVVLCTGAETSLSERLSRSFVPIYTWMAATEPLYYNCPLKKETADQVLSKIKPTGKVDAEHIQRASIKVAPMCGDDHFALNYWRNNNKTDGRLLFGSLCDTYVLPLSFISLRLRNALSEVYPQLNNVKFDYIWGGKLSVALNAMPIIGRDIDYDDYTKYNGADSITDGGVWYSTGFSGHGIVPTALAGSVIANAILGIPDREEVTDAKRKQLWQLFHTYFPPSSWNGYPYSRMGAGAVFVVYNTFDWLSKKGVPVPRLPSIW